MHMSIRLAAALTGVLGSTLVALSAQAWNSTLRCGEPLWLDGDSLTWHFVSGDFTTAERVAIEAGVDAWNAGTGEVLRGADWEFVKGGDVTVFEDDRTEVHIEDPDWMIQVAEICEEESLCPTAAVIRTYDLQDSCIQIGVDVVFNSDREWSTDLPSQFTSSATRSFAQTAMHEFGHVLGFSHDNSVLSTMNWISPHGGDPSRSHRINQTDSEGMKATYPGSSTGRNLMLLRFEPLTEGESRLVWASWSDSEDGRTWSATRGGSCVSGNDGPKPLQALITGTSGMVGVEVTWSLSLDADCFSAGDIEIDTKAYNFSLDDTPVAVVPDEWCVPNGYSAGEYRVCAQIDIDDDFNETSETDNLVVSDMTFEVL